MVEKEEQKKEGAKIVEKRIKSTVIRRRAAKAAPKKEKPAEAGEAAEAKAAPAAAQVQSRPAPPVDPVQVMEQLASGISRAVSLHRHHVRIHLQPPELGEVKVDLMVRQDHVSVSFVMEDSRVRDILEANLQQFRDQLASRGFTLAGLDVSVGGRDDDPSGKWRDLLARSFGSGGGRAVPSAAVEPAAVRVPPGGTAGGSGISVMV